MILFGSPEGGRGQGSAHPLQGCRTSSGPAGKDDRPPRTNSPVPILVCPEWPLRSEWPSVGTDHVNLHDGASPLLSTNAVGNARVRLAADPTDIG